MDKSFLIKEDSTFRRALDMIYTDIYTTNIIGYKDVPSEL